MGALRRVTPRLERRQLADRAWRRFVEERAEPSDVQDEIARSWRRARDAYRIDPGITRPGRVLPVEALGDRRERDPVFRVATPILADFSRRLGCHESVLAYLDGDGWVLSIDGDRGMVEDARQIDFRPGALWAEEVAGTNGPGTALAEGRPLEVFASEHFVAAWQGWSCAAAPVLRPGSPTPVGVVDISAPWQVQRRHALVIAKAIARAIEERLRAAVGVRDEVVRYALRAAKAAGDALVAVDAAGRVVGANDAATRRRIVDGGALTASAQEAVIAALRSPAAGIESDVELETPDGRTGVASPVRYEGAIVGAILRVSPPAPWGGRVVEPARGEVCLAGERSSGTLRSARLDAEREALLVALDASGWNIARTAEQLGVSRMTLYRRLHRLGISRSSAAR